MEKLKELLNANMRKIRGKSKYLTICLPIEGLDVLAMTTNGDSGIGKFGGHKYYWYYSNRYDEIFVEKD